MGKTSHHEHSKNLKHKEKKKDKKDKKDRKDKKKKTEKELKTKYEHHTKTNVMFSSPPIGISPPMVRSPPMGRSPVPSTLSLSSSDKSLSPVHYKQLPPELKLDGNYSLLNRHKSCGNMTIMDTQNIKNIEANNDSFIEIRKSISDVNIKIDLIDNS